MRKSIYLLCFTLTAIASHSQSSLDPALVQKAHESIGKGVNFLLEKQADDGSWISHPAVSALCITAIHDTKNVDKDKLDKAVNKGLNYVLKSAKPDGSIWSEDTHAFPNYTTAISLLALVNVNRPGDIDAIKNARKYLMDSQFSDRNTIDYGGIGYSKTGRADGTNLDWAAEALFYTDYLDQEPYNSDPAAAKRTRELWEKVQIFITNCQNLPELNKQSWVSNRDDDYGGFVYRPTESKAGSITDEQGKVSLLSSGSMTYSGLKSMIYAKMDRDDYRVKAAMDYVSRHYTLEENPGMGLQGLYFYLNIMAKSFSAYGEQTITDAAGAEHNWREEILTKLTSMQKPEGSWVNGNGRFMESVPELATSHALTAMKIAAGISN